MFCVTKTARDGRVLDTMFGVCEVDVVRAMFEKHPRIRHVSVCDAYLDEKQWPCSAHKNIHWVKRPR